MKRQLVPGALGLAAVLASVCAQAAPVPLDVDELDRVLGGVRVEATTVAVANGLLTFVGASSAVFAGSASQPGGHGFEGGFGGGFAGAAGSAANTSAGTHYNANLSGPVLAIDGTVSMGGVSVSVAVVVGNGVQN